MRHAKLVALVLILVAGYIFLGTVVLGTSRAPSVPHKSTTQPPRLFLNGEVARDAVTGRKVVVQSAQWDKTCHCYLYTVTPR